MSNSLVCQSEWERLGRKCQTEREVGNSLSDHVMPSCDFGETVSQERTSIFSVRLGIHGPQHRVTGAGGGGEMGTAVYSYVGQTRVIGHACLIKVTQVPLSPINILFFFFFLTHPSPTFNFHLSPFPPARSLVSFGQMTAVFSVFCR